jgi:hypothetical protein
MNWDEFASSLHFILCLDWQYLNTCLWLDFIKWENRKSILNCPVRDLHNECVFGKLESETSLYSE